MMFSIIVPIYKVEPYLDRCIISLREQTFQEIEIILVDDGSPDNCPYICDRYARDDNRIKVIHKDNGGLSDARNKGLEAAKGKYIIFVDADDYIELNTCERFAPFANKGYDILIGDAIIEGGFSSIQHIDAYEEIMSGSEYLKKSFIQKRAPMAAWLNIYKREFLLNNDLQFKFGILHEDEQFTPRAFLKANTVVCTKIDFYHYIIREDSITTRKDKRKNSRDMIDTCHELEIIYQEINDNTLRIYLLNSLVDKYLNMFQLGALFRYGNNFICKE